MRLDQIFIGAVGALNERGRHFALAGAHQDRVGKQRRRAAAVRSDLRTVLVLEQRDALAVNRDVHVFKARVFAVGKRDLEGVFAVRGENVIHHHAAARAIGRAVDVVPRMLGHVTGIGEGGINRRGILVADGHATDVGGAVQVRLKQRRRERLFVSNIVEVRAHGVIRQPPAGVDVELKQFLDGAGVLGAIQALEAAPAGIGISPGVGVDRGLERGDQLLIRGRLRTRHAWGRHHARPHLANHALGHVGFVGDLRDVKRREREIARLAAVAVATGAIPLHERVLFFVCGRRRGGMRHGRLAHRSALRGGGRSRRSGWLGGRCWYRRRDPGGRLLSRDCDYEPEAHDRCAQGDGTDASHSNTPEVLSAEPLPSSAT